MPTPTGPSRTLKSPSLDGLSDTAKTLTDASKRLDLAVDHLNAALRKLSFGISEWVHVSTNDSHPSITEIEQIGYARVKGTWGICIMQTIEGLSPEDEETTWHFKDAPRDKRI